MTKKYFIALADYLKDTEGYCEPFTEKQLKHIANFCHSQNFFFNRERWLAYIAGECGTNGGKVRIARSAASNSDIILSQTGGNVEIVED